MPKSEKININRNSKTEKVLTSFKVLAIVFSRFYNYFQDFASMKILSSLKALKAVIAPPLEFDER